MTTFLLDLWQDLRAKRLWPVAIALLAAMVAVPVMLLKPASSTPPATTAAATSKDGKLPAVTLDASSIADSHLDVFKEKNPFSSMSDATPAEDLAGVGDGTATDGSGDAAGKGGDGGAGATGGDTGAGSGGGTTPPGGSSSPPATDPVDGKPVEPGIHYFTYTADVLFGARGHTRAYKSLTQLDVLPDSNSPIVAFMGVQSGKVATFFIADPAFRADGEGSCQPSPDNCMFLSLRKDEDHNEATLSAQNGTIEFELKLTGLHVKRLSQDAVKGDTTPDTSSKRSTKRRKTLLSLPAGRVAAR
jgi:hypothetical protein